LRLSDWILVFLVVVIAVGPRHGWTENPWKATDLCSEASLSALAFSA